MGLEVARTIRPDMLYSSARRRGTEEDEGWEDDTVPFAESPEAHSPDLSPNDFHGFASGGTHALRTEPGGG